MKVTTDACLFGAWVASRLESGAKEPSTILDIGGGTGLLSLMLAQKTTHTEIHSVEIDEGAFVELTSNFKNSKWSDRLNSHHSPFQKFHPQGVFDVIVSNPPFFDSSLKGSSSAKNLALHTEMLDQKTLLHRIPELLSPSGLIYVLYPEREMHQFAENARLRSLHPVEWVMVRNRHESEVFRIMACFQFSNNVMQSITNEVTIKNPDQKYTDEFWSLLSDYYLEYNNPSQKSE